MPQTNDKWEEDLVREFGTVTSNGEYIIADRPDEIKEFIRTKLQEARNAALEEAAKKIESKRWENRNDCAEAIRALKKET